MYMCCMPIVQVPDLVHLHSLEGEGHISAFCCNDKIHRETLECLFGGAGNIGESDANRQAVKSDDQDAQGGNVGTETIQEGVSALDAPYIH